MSTIRPKAYDMRAVKLSAQEGFVLSRVVGTTSLKDLVDMSGLEEARVVEIIRRLVEQGALEIDPPLPSLTTSTSGIVAATEVAIAAGVSTHTDFVVRTEHPALSMAPQAAASLAVCGMSDVGIARTNNEDAFRVVDLTTGESLDVADHTLVDLGPRGMLLVVCDGMGGANAGEVASALAVEVICSDLSTSSRQEDAATAVRKAVEHANELVHAAADEPGRAGMGATVIAVLLYGAHAYTAEVGDSRAYVWRAGTLTQITKDQTYVQLLLDQGVLAPEAVKSSTAKNVVLQAVGKAPEVIVAQHRLSLRSGDRILLCSDGLSSFVTDAEISAVLEASVSLDEACTELVRLANARGGHDNVTVIAALVSEPLPSPGPNETVQETLRTLRAFAIGEGDSSDSGDRNSSP